MPLERWIWTLIWWNTQHINGEKGLKKTINQISNFCQKIGPLKFNILNVLQMYTIKIDKLSEMTKSAVRCLRTWVWPEPKAWHAAWTIFFSKTSSTGVKHITSGRDQMYMLKRLFDHNRKYSSLVDCYFWTLNLWILCAFNTLTYALVNGKIYNGICFKIC